MTTSLSLSESRLLSFPAGFIVRFDVRVAGECILTFDRQTVCPYC